MSDPTRPSRATLFDVCQTTGLSTATVSRVLNNSPHVSPATRDRVMQAMQSLGYVPHHAARSLAGQKQDMLGVVFPEISSGFWSEVLRGLNAAAGERGYHLLTAFSHGGPDERNLVMRLLGEGRIDALIVMNLRLGEALAEEAKAFATPVVLIDRPIVGPNLSAVTIDNIAGAHAAMAHLYAHGHRDVLIFSGDAETFDSRQRLLGCQRAAAQAGVAWRDDLVLPGAFTEESGRELMGRRLAQGAPPSAVFCFNDNLALGAMEALQDRGLRVPEDVAIVGFDDIVSARHVGLTTVHVPLHDLGRAAADAAFHAIAGDDYDRHTILATRLVVRRTCGCTATSSVT